MGNKILAQAKGKASWRRKYIVKEVWWRVCVLFIIRAWGFLVVGGMTRYNPRKLMRVGWNCCHSNTRIVRGHIGAG